MSRVYSLNRFIIIYGNDLENCVKAVIVPNKAYGQHFATQDNLKEFDFNNPDKLFHDEIIKDLCTNATKESLQKHEIPRKIVIDFQVFTPENGLRALSMNLCRPELVGYYVHQLKDNNSIDDQLKMIIEKATKHQLSVNETDQLLITDEDSLIGLRLSHMIFYGFGVSIPLSFLFQLNTTSQRLVNVIKDLSQMPHPSESMITQLLSDCQLKLNIAINKP